jgi:hypothetical protein
MKIVYFLKWVSANFAKQVKSFDRWMWAWVATCFFGSMYFSVTKDTALGDFAKGALIALIFGFWVGYGLIYTGTKTAWRKFNEEQNKVLDHLKDSK